MNYKILLIFAVLALTVSGCIEVGQITPSLSSNSPMQVSVNETITITASISNYPLSEAIVRVTYVDPNQLIVIDNEFISNMNVIGTTNTAGMVQYTVPTGVAGKRMIYAAEKPSSFNSPGFGIAYVI